eukprot:gene119-biopygen116
MIRWGTASGPRTHRGSNIPEDRSCKTETYNFRRNTGQKSKQSTAEAMERSLVVLSGVRSVAQSVDQMADLTAVNSVEH